MPNRDINDMSQWLDDSRVALNLPCQLMTAEEQFAGKIVDLSFGGASIQLSEGLETANPRSIRHLTSDHIGLCDVIFRWERQGRIGVSFKNEDLVRPQLAEFLENTESSGR